jgi:transmembrane sensor
MSANSRRARASAEAAEWWVRIESSDMTRADREQFVDWLRESAVHVAEMLRMAEVHGALERFHDWVRIPTDDAAVSGGEKEAHTATNVIVFASPGEPRPQSLQTVTPSNTRRRWTAGVALAATVAALGVFLALFFSAQVIETGRAERRSVTLADGSVLQIDPESRLRIRLEKHQREISLERGRAMFRVARDPARPFLVRADSTQVRVLGTQFGVEQAREGIVVTVAEGKVAVGSSGTAAVDASNRSSPSDRVDRARGAAASPAVRTTTGRDSTSEVLLTAGQQVIVPRRGPAAAVRAVDTDRELAWVAGRLVFDNESVADVIDEFNRYNVVQLHVASPQLAQRSVSGVFDASEPESFIGFMQSVVPVDVRRAGQDITIALAP